MTAGAVPQPATAAATPDDGSLLAVDGLTVDFATESGWTRVVEDVSFAIAPNQVVGLVGESGSGKTVTALSILGLLPKRSSRIARGSAVFEGRELVGMRRHDLRRLRGDRIAIIFQEPMTSLNPSLTVGEQIAEQVRVHRAAGRRQAWRRAVEMLDRVGIPSASARARSYPHEFSGGMRQRAMIAMALSCDPSMLIADEPTTALDVTIQALILDLLRDVQEEFHLAVLFVTHDLGVVADMCDQVVVLYAGQVVESAATAELFTRPLHPYTKGLLRSLPQAGVRGRLWSIPGIVPKPDQLPQGCRFHPRCEYAVEALCAREPLALERFGTRLARCARVSELTEAPL